MSHTSLFVHTSQNVTKKITVHNPKSNHRKKRSSQREKSSSLRKSEPACALQNSSSVLLGVKTEHRQSSARNLDISEDSRTREMFELELSMMEAEQLLKNVEADNPRQAANVSETPSQSGELPELQASIVEAALLLENTEAEHPQSVINLDVSETSRASEMSELRASTMKEFLAFENDTSLSQASFEQASEIKDKRELGASIKTDNKLMIKNEDEGKKKKEKPKSSHRKKKSAQRDKSRSLRRSASASTLQKSSSSVLGVKTERRQSNSVRHLDASETSRVSEMSNLRSSVMGDFLAGKIRLKRKKSEAFVHSRRRWRRTRQKKRRRQRELPRQAARARRNMTVVNLMKVRPLDQMVSLS